MTILQIMRDLDYGGVQTFVIRMAALLAARGHRVLLASGNGPQKAAAEAAGLQCHVVPARGLEILHTERRLREIMRGEGVEVAHGHHGTMGIAASLAANRAGVPFTYTVHSPWNAWRRLYIPFLPWRIQAVSAVIRDNLIRRFNLAPERVMLNPIGIDTDLFSPETPSPAQWTEPRVDPTAPIVLHVSRFSAKKSRVGLALIEAAPELAADFPDIVILLAGAGGHSGEVQAAAHKMNAKIGRDTVRFLGPRADIPRLMRQATIVVGTAGVALEALSSGCPVVGAGKFGFTGLIEPRGFSASFASFFGDHEAPRPVAGQALAEAIHPLLADSGRRDALSRWGRQKIVEELSLVKAADRIEEIYRELLAAAPAYMESKA
jgi:glycosyltransferase involved in cell wall biosynthesis